MLFATKKHPKGPSLTRWKHHAIALSGNILHLDLPPGNDTFVPISAETSTEQFDIYNTEAYKYTASKAEDICSINTLISRDYCYRSFSHPALGSIRFTADINQVYDRQLNLFKHEQFSECANKSIKSDYSTSLVEINARDPFIQNSQNDHLSPLTWQVHHIDESNSIKTINYATALTDIHFINIMFRYLSVYNPKSPWVLMGHELEQRIMNAIRIEFSPSVLQEQQAAREA